MRIASGCCRAAIVMSTLAMASGCDVAEPSAPSLAGSWSSPTVPATTFVFREDGTYQLDAEKTPMVLIHKNGRLIDAEAIGWPKKGTYKLNPLEAVLGGGRTEVIDGKWEIVLVPEGGNPDSDAVTGYRVAESPRVNEFFVWHGSFGEEHGGFYLRRRAQ
jgi:hypothetical protein